MQKQKIRTTLIIDKNIIKQIKEVALEKETTQTEIINEYLLKGLNNEKLKESKVKNIVKKNPKLKLMKKTSLKKDTETTFEDLIGTIKPPKGFDPVKAVEEIRKRDFK